MDSEKIKIKLKMFNGNEHTIEVGKNDRISVVRKKVNELEGINEEQLRFVLDGQPQYLKRISSEYLSDFDMKDGSVIEVKLRQGGMPIHIKTSVEKFTLHVDALDTVGYVKRMIAAEKALPVGQIRLIFAGKLIEDGKVLSDYGICRDSTIHMVVRV